jgi:hypothetical protein
VLGLPERSGTTRIFWAVTALVSIWLALVLGLSAGLKAWRHRPAGEALATYGISGPAAQRLAIGTLIAVEAVIVGGLILALPVAATAAAVLLLVFTAASTAALFAGRAGRPCACFGSSSRLAWFSPLRSLALAAVAGVLAAGRLPGSPHGYDRWLTLGLSLAIATTCALGVAVLALAREVGVLRLSEGALGALEIPEEGPELGEHQGWAAAVPRRAGAVLLLAVFTSEGCPLCRRVAPAVAHVAGDPLLGVRTFDEHLDTAVWAQAGVPGSPYAVALSLDGVALAKGTFNSLAQLESVLATARRRGSSVQIAA